MKKTEKLYFFTFKRQKGVSAEDRVNRLFPSAYTMKGDVCLCPNLGLSLKDIRLLSKLSSDYEIELWHAAGNISFDEASSEMVMKNGGMKIEEAMNIKPKDIADYLGGLPARKFHCSILADKAFKKAVEIYRNTNAKTNF